MSTPNSSSMTGPKRSADVLRQARRRDSQTKRTRVRSTVDDMLASGERISFTAVARKARVSTWLVYADGVREHIENAIAHQAHNFVSKDPFDDASPWSLRTDLALARAEIKCLRAERDNLRRSTQRLLGHQLEQAHTSELIERVDSLVAENQAVSAQLDQKLQENSMLQRRVIELEEEVAAARTALRRMIKEQSSTGNTKSDAGDFR
jgi:hypothetical protein